MIRRLPVKECDDLYVTPDDDTCEDTADDDFDHPTLIIKMKRLEKYHYRE